MTDENTDENIGATDAEPTVAELDGEAAESTEETAQSKPRRSWSLAAVALLAVALLGSAGVAAWLYFAQYRSDQATDADAEKVALDAARSGTEALLSYAPDTLEENFKDAKSRLTGDFLSYYTQFTEQIVTPAAQEKQVKTTASVVRGAVSDLSPDSATVLVFVNQTTTSKENPDGAFAASSVKVELTKIDGSWLISSFDPV